jgi:hypothetical protein
MNESELTYFELERNEGDQHFVETPEFIAAVKEALREAETEPDRFQTYEEIMAELDECCGESS